MHDALFCCWLDAQATFKSSKSFLEIHDALFCCWFDSRTFFTSFKSSLISSTLLIPCLMMFTASSNVEDSHDALSSTVDCALIDDRIISTLITATGNARQCALDIVMTVYSKCVFTDQSAFSVSPIPHTTPVIFTSAEVSGIRRDTVVYIAGLEFVDVRTANA